MNRIYPLLAVVVVVTIGAMLTGQTTASDTDVAVSFFPIHSMTTAVAEDTGLETALVIPPGTDPHSFDPSPSDLQQIRGARLYIATGAGLANWEQELLTGIDDRQIVRADTGIELIQAGQGHGDDHGHDHGDLSVDPHYWLSPQNALTMTRTIYQALADAYPERNATLWSNYQAYRQELTQLDQAYRDGLSGCRKEMILTTHAAYSYLAQDYGFEQHTMMGLTPVSEPTPRQIQRLTELADEHNLSYIFYEDQVDPRIATTIADQVGARTMSLSPVLGGDGHNYTAAMHTNLDRLMRGMGCR